MDNFEKRIAFPTNDRENVEAHFGHCREFALCDITDNKVVSKQFITPPAHQPGVLPRFLAEQKATAIITGGMGGMAVNLFKENNIEVILGATGSIDENLEIYLQGNLESTGSQCDHGDGDHHHEHHHHEH
jgi:predicted Fe-Mo cluster-binding NifX family protein